MSPVELTTTEGGTLALDEPIEGRCLSCRQLRDVAPVSVTKPDRSVDTLHLCGQCLSAALGVHLARNVVATDGWAGMFPIKKARPHGA